MKVQVKREDFAIASKFWGDKAPSWSNYARISLKRHNEVTDNLFKVMGAGTNRREVLEGMSDEELYDICRYYYADKRGIYWEYRNRAIKFLMEVTTEYGWEFSEATHILYWSYAPHHDRWVKSDYNFELLEELGDCVERIRYTFDVSEEQATAIYKLASRYHKRANPINYAYKEVMTDSVILDELPEERAGMREHIHLGRGKWCVIGGQLLPDERIARDLWFEYSGTIDWREYFLQGDPWGKQACLQEYFGFGMDMMFHPLYDYIDWDRKLQDMEASGEYAILEDEETGYACLFHL